jgi:hypothetical protein
MSMASCAGEADSDSTSLSRQQHCGAASSGVVSATPPRTAPAVWWSRCDIAQAASQAGLPLPRYFVCHLAAERSNVVQTPPRRRYKQIRTDGSNTGPETDNYTAEQ